MIRVLTTISYDHTLLPKFMRYYMSLGVDEFTIAVKHEGNLWEGVCAAIKGFPATVIDISEEQKRTNIEGANKEYIRQQVAVPSDWLIPADLDEFYQFTDTIRNLIAHAQRHSISNYTGYFSDRIT